MLHSSRTTRLGPLFPRPLLGSPSSQTVLPPFSTTSQEGDHRDFTFQVSMTILKGGCGGMLFRNDGAPDSYDYYLFEICQDGRYSLLLDRTNTALIPLAKNPAINADLGRLNIIAVVVNGKNIDLYVNNQKIHSFQGGNHANGRIGLFANPNGTVPTEVAFNNAEVWT